jgi:hypothetical protein
VSRKWTRVLPTIASRQLPKQYKNPKYQLRGKYHVDELEFQWKECPKALQQTKTKLPTRRHKQATVAKRSIQGPAVPAAQNSAKTTIPNKKQNALGF